jgi:hypothetical protein
MRCATSGWTPPSSRSPGRRTRHSESCARAAQTCYLCSLDPQIWHVTPLACSRARKPRARVRARQLASRGTEEPCAN